MVKRYIKYVLLFWLCYFEGIGEIDISENINEWEFQSLDDKLSYLNEVKEIFKVDSLNEELYYNKVLNIDELTKWIEENDIYAL